ncbi:MAG: tetratricopeptide repeat protein [Burkholderiaceae bacterium]
MMPLKLGLLTIGLTIGLLPAQPGQAATQTRAEAEPQLIFQILASELALQQGNVAIAAATYLRVAEQTRDAAAAERATQLALALRAPAQALAAAKIWLEAKPNEPNAQETVDALSLLLGFDHDLSDSLLKRRQAITSSEQLDGFYERLSNLLIRSQDPRRALSILSRVSAQEPDHTKLLYAKAMLHEKLKEHAQAEQALRTLISRTPGDAHALNALGYSLADRNQSLPEARALLEKAHQLRPDDAHILDSVGWVYYRLGRFDQAIDWLQKAFVRMPDAEVAAHLGEVLWKSNRATEAFTIWRHGRQTDPNNQLLQDTLKRFGISFP